MKLNLLKISGYRGFESYEIDQVRDVNLIVGRNNSGKTALLECFAYTSTDGDPRILHESLMRRGELLPIDNKSPEILNMEQLFNDGHQTFSLDSTLHREGVQIKHRLNTSEFSYEQHLANWDKLSRRLIGPTADDLLMKIEKTRDNSTSARNVFFVDRGVFDVEKGLITFVEMNPPKSVLWRVAHAR